MAANRRGAPSFGSVHATPCFLGSRQPRFPAPNGTIKVLRLPAPLPLGLWFRRPRAPASFVLSLSRSRHEAGPGPRLDWSGWPFPFQPPPRTDEASQVPWRSIPQFCNGPPTPVGTPIAACPVQPPLSQRRRRQHCEFRGSIALLRCPLCTLHDLRCRMQHSLPAGGRRLCGSSTRWTASKSFRHIIMTSSLPELRLALCESHAHLLFRPGRIRRFWLVLPVIGDQKRLAQFPNRMHDLSIALARHVRGEALSSSTCWNHRR